jgi:hypothetical protein
VLNVLNAAKRLNGWNGLNGQSFLEPLNFEQPLGVERLEPLERLELAFAFGKPLTTPILQIPRSQYLAQVRRAWQLLKGRPGGPGQPLFYARPELPLNNNNRVLTTCFIASTAAGNNLYGTT